MIGSRRIDWVRLVGAAELIIYKPYQRLSVALMLQSYKLASSLYGTMSSVVEMARIDTRCVSLSQWEPASPMGDLTRCNKLR
jgi:hypothetical protein